MKRRSSSTALRQIVPMVLLGIATSLPTNAGIPEPDLVWYGKVLSSAGGASVRVTTGTLEWQLEPTAGGPALVLTTALTNINDQFSFVLRVPCESPEPGVANSSSAIPLTTPPARYRRMSVTLDGQPLAFGNTAPEFAPLPTDRGGTERIDLHLGAIAVESIPGGHWRSCSRGCLAR